MHEASLTELREFAELAQRKTFRSTELQNLPYEHPLPSKSIIASISEVAPPKRDGDRIWFRSEDHIKGMIERMILRWPLPPIEVFSKGKKSDHYVVRDGFHRYYACVALNIKFLPVKTNDWDFEIM